MASVRAVFEILAEQVYSSDDEESFDEELVAPIFQQMIAEVDQDVLPIGERLQTIVQHLDCVERTTVQLYAEHTVPLYSDREFVTHFRLRRGVVRDLIEQFGASDVFRDMQGHGGFEPVTPEKHLLAFLWFVGHQTSSYRDVADRFNLSLSALHSIISRVIDFFMTMAQAVIKDPTPQEKDPTKAYYLNTRGFPGVIGSIDGSHVRIDAPSQDKDAYINRKHYFSIHMQGVVNEKKKFVDVFIGYPGSVHDARVFACSPLSLVLSSVCQGGEYLLGDAAYPCLPHLITPYRDNGHLTNAQKYFNRVHSSCRVTVEHGFGMLKQRFRQLYHLKLRDIKRMVQLIHTCCVLHNLADLEDLQEFEPPENDDFPDEEVQGNIYSAAEGGNYIPLADEDGDPDDTTRGKDLRDEICRQLNARR